MGARPAEEGLALFSQPAHAQEPDWTWQNPLPQGNPLWGVWGSSGSDVFAVGDLGTILHYSGDGGEVFLFLPLVVKDFVP